MHMFHADMLNHYIMITQHHLIHFYIVVWVSNVGWMTRFSQVLSAAPTLFELVHQWNTAICCEQPLSYTCFIWEWMSTVLQFLYTESGWQCHACLDNSMSVIHWTTSCCAEATHSSLLMTFAYHGQQWPLSDGTRMTNITLYNLKSHVVCFF